MQKTIQALVQLARTFVKELSTKLQRLITQNFHVSQCPCQDSNHCICGSNCYCFCCKKRDE